MCGSVQCIQTTFRPDLDFFVRKSSALGRNGGSWNGLAAQYVCNFSRGPSLLDSGAVQPLGGLQVDLTLRLNVIAVCAAVVFVGAILVMF